MPELPEVEVLVRHLAPLLQGRRVRNLQVRRLKVIAPTLEREFRQKLVGARFVDLNRRGKYLVFRLRTSAAADPFVMVGHLGMTGRMYLLPVHAPLPKHAAVVLDLGGDRFVFEDTRYFGRLTLDASAPARLGPEPLEKAFQLEGFSRALRRSTQAIKVKLLDQTLLAGVGNIYASEALFRARISPRLSSRQLSRQQTVRLRGAIRSVLSEAIRCGSTVPLSYSGNGTRDGLFYFGRSADAPESYEERFRVYDRAGQLCPNCRRPILRIVQAARSTFYCAKCQGESEKLQIPKKRQAPISKKAGA